MTLAPDGDDGQRLERYITLISHLRNDVSALGATVTSNPIIRRLVAIVIADVVGYTRLMEQDEGGTHARLREIRDEVVDPKIAAFDGRVVRTVGDGMLLEFGSAAAALRFAIEVQRAMAARNQALASDMQIQYRFGINLGDIIVDGADIAGDGVNIAARLETLSEPGGICLSSAVQDQIHEDLGVEFLDIGNQYVKNIARPIRVYRVVPGNGAAQRQFRRRWQLLRRAFASSWAAGGVFALGIVALAFWAFPQFWKSDAVPLAPLSVAILPLSATAGAADEQLADTFTQDVTSALETSAHWVRVISHSLAATYKSNPIDARRVGRELKARYLVEGTVRRASELVIVNLQLIDASTATQLWSGRLDVEQSQIAQNRESFVARLTRRLYVALYDAEMRRNAGPPVPGASAMDLTMHAWGVLSRDGNTMKGTLEARKWFDQALQLDPNLQLALRGRWRTLRHEYELDPHADRGRLVQEMDDLSFRAVSVDEMDSHAWWDRAKTLSLQQRWDAALEANAKAHRLDPSFGGPRNQRASIMFYMGRPAEAVRQIDQELALDPHEPSEVAAAMQVRCAASLALGRYDDAISACAKCVALDNWWLPHLYLVSAYAQKGDSANADAEKAALLKLRPGISISDFKRLWYSNNPDFVQQSEAHLLAGLRKAGIPEQ